MKKREINQVDQHGGSFVNSNLHLQGWEDLRTGNTVSGCHFLQEFSAEKTEINHGVENLAKYVITCGNWGHKWRRWKYLSLIVIISDSALGWRVVTIFWPIIYLCGCLSTPYCLGLWDYLNVKSHPSLSLWYPPLQSIQTASLCPQYIQMHTDRFHTQSYRVKKGSILFAQYSIGRRKTLLLLWIKNNNPNQQ